MNVIYSAEALDDLKRLREFIALHNPSAAIRIASELVSKIEHLSTFPELGTEVKQAPSPKVIRNIVLVTILLGMQYLPMQ